MSETPFLNLSDDIVLNVFFKLDEDPRHWARVACVCTKFSSLIRTICCKQKCLNSINSVVSDLLSSKSSFGGHPFNPQGNWWASLHKLGVCCPGLLHAGILLENSDFGLERDIGPDHRFSIVNSSNLAVPGSASSTAVSPAPIPHSGVSWSLYDDLYFDTMYVPSEVHSSVSNANVTRTITDEHERVVNNTTIATTTRRDESERVMTVGNHLSGLRMKQNSCGPIGSHLATGTWNLSREQGNKLLASRFRGDCLYICDWPGCLHTEEKRRYMLFRGVFKDFKGSRVWRTINDGNQSKIALGCAFCSCKDTYDLHSSFCLRRVFGYHDDGEPVVRAFVCENGHVSGAWTERPMYA